MTKVFLALASVATAGCVQIPQERAERDRIILAAVEPCKERYAERLHNPNMMSVLPDGRVRYWYRDGQVTASYDLDRCLTDATKDLRLGPWRQGRLSREGPTTVPITIVDKDTFVQVRINGVVGTMAVRPAPNFTFITERFAKRAGVEVVGESPTIRVTVGGQSMAKPYARARAIEVGTRRLRLSTSSCTRQLQACHPPTAS